MRKQTTLKANDGKRFVAGHSKKVHLCMCGQQRLRSVCVSTQSDKSLLGTLGVAKVLMILHTDSEGFDQTVWMHRLI